MTGARVRPGRVAGTATAPPSKSMTHRAYLLAALSATPATVTAPLRSADTDATLACLHALGARMHVDARAVRFEPSPLRPPVGVLDCANSGTTLRLVAATAARLAQPVTLTGDASLRLRPNGALLDALRTLGVSCRSAAGKAPITVQGPLRAGAARIPPNSSSQAASALALALPFTDGASTLLVQAPIASRPYLELTLAMAAQAGLRIERQDSPDGSLRLGIPGGQEANLGACAVEGDWSSAAFLLAAAALTAGDVTVLGLRADSVQGDRAILVHLEAVGCSVASDAQGVRVTGPQRLRALGRADVSATPDLFPVLAVLAAAAEGTTVIHGGLQLRAKESDRIAAMAAGLRAVGVRATETQDGLVVQGGPMRGAPLPCASDHRIHMALTLAALAAAGESVIEDAQVARVSFPGFHDALQRLGAQVSVQAEVSP